MTRDAFLPGGSAGRSEALGLRDHEGRRILVVEDSPSARKLMQELLLRLGVPLPDLRLAATASEALQLFAQWRPDVVFVDLELRLPPDVPAAPPPAPGGPTNGAELGLQMLARDPAVQLVVCSATDPTDSPMAHLVREGKVLSIVKPVLAAKVQQVLASLGTPGAPPSRRRT